MSERGKERERERERERGQGGRKDQFSRSQKVHLSNCENAMIRVFFLPAIIIHSIGCFEGKFASNILAGKSHSC